jgi:hypothetical protein
MDELADLIIEVASDERKLAAVAAQLTAMDMEQLGIPVMPPDRVKQDRRTLHTASLAFERSPRRSNNAI